MTFKNQLCLFLILMMFAACNNETTPLEPDVFYTCSMHPQILVKKYGTCPICKMALTKIKIDPNEKDIIKLSDEQILYGNITMEPVTKKSINGEFILHGKITVNQDSLKTISAWVPGRIENLKFKTIGESIKVGDILYSLYSENLFLAQKEFVMAKKLLNDKKNNADYLPIYNATRNKLLLWGLTQAQIDSYQTINNLSPITSIFSKVSGTIQSVNSKEGDVLMEGTSIFQIVDLRKVWLEAEAFSSDLEFIQVGQAIECYITSFKNEKVKGTIDFISPELQNNSKINIVRVIVDNPEYKYKPGMLVKFHVKTKTAEGLIVPFTSLLQTENGTAVWIQNKTGGFEIKRVTVGTKNTESAEIINGLSENDTVVKTGAYLLYSEFIFKKGHDPIRSKLN